MARPVDGPICMSFEDREAALLISEQASIFFFPNFVNKIYKKQQSILN